MRRHTPTRAATIVVSVYLAVAWLWVIGSDQLVDPLVAATAWTPGQVEIGKGLWFVTGIGALLWGMLIWQGRAVSESERRWADLASSSPDGLFIADLNPTVFRYANPAFERITGRPYSAFAADATLPFQLVSDEGLERLQRLWVDPYSQRWPVELQVTRPDGSRRTVELSGRITEGRAGRARFEGVVVDVTEQKERERDLRSAAAAAEAATRAERAAADALARTSELKDALLTSVSHELRTPTTLVLGMAETLQARRGALPAAQRSQLEDTLADHARTLARLVDDLLQFDRPAPKLPDLRPVDVARLVAAEARTAPVADRVTLHTPRELHARADADQLRRVVAELLSNAAKYAPDGPVQVTVDSDADSWWYLEVADHGPGLPDSELGRVFDPLHRVALDHPSPGTGLGLALVARYVDAHRGQVLAANRDGLTILVRLPVEPDRQRPQLRVV